LIREKALESGAELKLSEFKEIPRGLFILPAEDVELVEQSSGDMISELAALLTEFAGSAVPDLIEAQEILGDVPTEAAEEEVSAEPSDESLEEEEQAAPKPITLREPRLHGQDC
jgi:hypothetical protein